jgi:hypothetical protein
LGSWLYPCDRRRSFTILIWKPSGGLTKYADQQSLEWALFFLIVFSPDPHPARIFTPESPPTSQILPLSSQRRKAPQSLPSSTVYPLSPKTRDGAPVHAQRSECFPRFRALRHCKPGNLPLGILVISLPMQLPPPISSAWLLSKDIPPSWRALPFCSGISPDATLAGEYTRQSARQSHRAGIRVNGATVTTSSRT